MRRETLLAGVLDPEYELGIMNFRESHRGTLLGMTRFRDVLDDMPILGYGVRLHALYKITYDSVAQLGPIRLELQRSPIAF